MSSVRSGIACLLTVLMITAPAVAAPYAFEQPPTLDGQAAVLGAPSAPTAAAAAPATGCRPQGSIARNGSIVTVALDFMRAKFTINNPDRGDPRKDGEDPVELRSYGGCKSGPTVLVKPGDTLRVNLNNRTDTLDPSCFDPPPAGLSMPLGVGCFNTTNLHMHGLHVSPAGNSDNVLLNIAPQTQFPYEINIPEDHPAGTFWYHAHRHGSTAVQVASGASGVLIIQGNRPYTPLTALNPHPIADIDTILHDVRGNALREQTFLFQQIAYACFKNADEPIQGGGPWQQIYTKAGLYNAKSSGESASAPWICPPAKPGDPVTAGVIENFFLQLDSSSIWDTNGRFTSINGIVQPTLTLPAGEIQRWRFVHSGIHDTINLQVVRASPVGGSDLIAASALSGNRLQQQPDLNRACNATPATLVPQFEIAADGLTRAKMHTVRAGKIGAVTESNYLQPGYRSDILVAFPGEGDYCLLNQAAPASERASNGGGGQGPSTPQLLAYVHVRGGQAVPGDLEEYVRKSLYDANPQLPDDVRKGLLAGNLAPWAPFTNLPAPRDSELQRADFTINVVPTNPPNNQVLFQVNGKSYDPNVVNITRQVNTVDDWVLTAQRDNPSQGEPHIFHIHVNPFQILDVTTTLENGQQVSIYKPDGSCRAELVASDTQSLANQYCGLRNVFKDTIFVENNYQVHIRTKYERYIGEYVLHCHILDHEDGGMMLNVAIVPDLKAPGHGLGMTHAHQ